MSIATATELAITIALVMAIANLLVVVGRRPQQAPWTYRAVYWSGVVAILFWLYLRNVHGWERSWLSVVAWVYFVGCQFALAAATWLDLGGKRLATSAATDRRQEARTVAQDVRGAGQSARGAEQDHRGEEQDRRGEELNEQERLMR